MMSALDLIHEGCFDQVAAGCHSLLAGHEHLGSLEMSNNTKLTLTLLTANIFFFPHKITSNKNECLTLTTSVKDTLSMFLEISSGGQ